MYLEVTPQVTRYYHLFFFRRIIKLKVWDHGKLLQGLFFKMFVVAGKLC